MSIDVVRRALLWCFIINYGILMIWFLMFVFGHGWMYRFLGNWFHMSTDLFDAFNLVGIGVYKIGIIMFNLVPYVALRIVGRE